MTMVLAHEYFSRSVQAYPDKCAVVCKEESVTYLELDKETNSIANGLRSLGVSRGQCVGFCMPKSINSIRCLLGIMKNDCAYVPLDANSPAKRLLAISNAIEMDVVLVDSDTESVVEGYFVGTQVQVVNVSTLLRHSSESPVIENISLDLAYVLFTSGSTGVPKGVMIPHKAIVDYIDWCIDEYQISHTDNVANHAPLYFDNSTFDIYTAFGSGATLYLVHEELNAVLPRLAQWLDQQSITIFFCVPSVLTILLQSRRLERYELEKLRRVIFAGEVVTPYVLRDWMNLFPHIEFTNMYGPTEITVDCTYYHVHQIPDGNTPIPIGWARRNMELFIRTADGEIIPAKNTDGELLVRGVAVAYGYIGEPDKTDEVFIPAPEQRYGGDRLYCTGDLVSADANGLIHFLGRADQQIKYLGHRIELGEIENTILALDGVEEAVVCFSDQGDINEQGIGLAIKLRQPEMFEEIQATFKDHLPPYMRPMKVKLVTGDLPRTPNGKYDRKQVTEQLFGN